MSNYAMEPKSSGQAVESKQVVDAAIYLDVELDNVLELSHENEEELASLEGGARSLVSTQVLSLALALVLAGFQIKDLIF